MVESIFVGIMAFFFTLLIGAFCYSKIYKVNLWEFKNFGKKKSDNDRPKSRW